jgi:hypothetical protein
LARVISKDRSASRNAAPNEVADFESEVAEFHLAFAEIYQLRIPNLKRANKSQPRSVALRMPILMTLNP